MLLCTLAPYHILFFHAQNEQNEKSITKEIRFVIEFIESRCFDVCLLC
jgi:hypothetical protein